MSKANKDENDVEMPEIKSTDKVVKEVNGESENEIAAQNIKEQSNNKIVEEIKEESKAIDETDNTTKNENHDAKGDKATTDNEDEIQNGCLRCLCTCWYCKCVKPYSVDHYPQHRINSEEERQLRNELPPAQDDPMQVKCPKCREEVTTNVDKEPSYLTCLISCAICLTGVGCLGPCMIPYCMERTLNVEHFCPNCGTYINTLKRM